MDITDWVIYATSWIVTFLCNDMLQNIYNKSSNYLTIDGLLE